MHQERLGAWDECVELVGRLRGRTHIPEPGNIFFHIRTPIGQMLANSDRHYPSTTVHSLSRSLCFASTRHPHMRSSTQPIQLQARPVAPVHAARCVSTMVRQLLSLFEFSRLLGLSVPALIPSHV